MFCSKCGSLVEQGAAFCANCGQANVATSRPLSVPSQYPGDAIAPATPASFAVQHAAFPSTSAASTVAYAGFWLRFVAYLIDSAVLGATLFALFIPFAAWLGFTSIWARARSGENPNAIANAMMSGTFVLGIVFLAAASIVGGWLYHALMESSTWEGTLGKRALNLRVTDLSGARVTFKRATGRHFGKIITSFIPLGIGYVVAGFTERRQAVHDMLSSCLVLRNL